jgi:hypothetical protein
MSTQENAAIMTCVDSRVHVVIRVALPLSIERVIEANVRLSAAVMMAEYSEFIEHPRMGRSMPKVDDASELLEFLW